MLYYLFRSGILLYYAFLLLFLLSNNRVLPTRQFFLFYVDNSSPNKTFAHSRMFYQPENSQTFTYTRQCDAIMPKQEERTKGENNYLAYKAAKEQESEIDAVWYRRVAISRLLNDMKYNSCLVLGWGERKISFCAIFPTQLRSKHV